MGKLKRYMALDFGGVGGVAMAGGFDGDKLEVEAMHRFAVRSTAMMGVSYWDFPAMIIHAKTGLTMFSAKYGPELAGVACDSWSADFGLLDKTGHLLGNPVHHLDPRTQGLIARFHGTMPERSLYQRTGVKSRRESTLYQLYSMALSNSPLLDKAVTMLMMADLVSYFLSGIPVQEYTLATTTCMCDAESRDWSRDIIISAKIPPVMMPEIVAPGTVIGPMLDAVAAECGLSHTPIIAPGSHSMAGAVAAAPAKGEDWMYIVCGDWDQVGVEVSTPVINDASFVDGFSNEGGVDGSIRFLKGIMGFVILEECMKTWAREDGRPLDLESVMGLAEPGQPITRLYHPDDPGIYDADDMTVYLQDVLRETGQPPAESRADFVRLCLHSMIVAHRHAVEQLVRLTGKRYNCIHLVGSGAAVPSVCQALADATGYVIKAGPVEAKAIGNILMQATALGDITSLAEAREVVASSFDIAVYEPSGDSSRWDEAYERFLKLL